MNIKRLLTITGVLLAAAAGVASAQASDEFLIGAWLGIPDTYCNEARYAELAAANFTALSPAYTASGTVAANKTILDLSYKNGLKALIFDPRIRSADLANANYLSEMDAAIEDYRLHPGLLGYDVYDEPGSKDFARVSIINKRLLQKDPAHLPFITLFPTGCTTEQYGVPTYDQYVDQYISTVGPKWLCYDHYTQMANGQYIGEAYFNNLEIIRNRALANKLPFISGLLLANHYNYRSPSLNDLRWEAYTSLAYGVKGIWWFTYWTMSEWGFGPGVVDVNGPTSHYSDVSKVNGQVKALGRTLVNLQSDAVYHVGNVPASGKALPSNALVTSVTGANAVIALFHNASGVPYVMIMNKDMQAGHDITFSFKQTVSLYEVSHDTGIPSKVGRQQSFKMPFLAGEGRLFKVALTEPTTGCVKGTVTSGTTPLSGVLITTADAQYQTLTGSDGRYTLEVPGAANYTIFAKHAGYAPGQAAVNVISGATINQNFSMTSGAAVSGRISDNQSGSPISGATVSIIGTTYSATTDAQGRYNLTIPGGIYSLSVSAAAHKSLTKKFSIGTGSLEMLNFSLQASASGGAKSSGLLSKVWGRVTRIADSSSGFYIDDGTGKEIKIELANRLDSVDSIPSKDQYVTVTGVSSSVVETSGDENKYQSVIIPASRSSIDIVNE